MEPISVAMALSVRAVLRVIMKRGVLSGHGARSSRRPAVHSSNSFPQGLNRSGNPSARGYGFVAYSFFRPADERRHEHSP